MLLLKASLYLFEVWLKTHKILSVGIGNNWLFSRTRKFIFCIVVDSGHSNLTYVLSGFCIVLPSFLCPLSIFKVFIIEKNFSIFYVKSGQWSFGQQKVKHPDFLHITCS